MVAQLVLVDRHEVSCRLALHAFAGDGAHREGRVDGLVGRRVVHGERRVVLVLVDGVHADPLAACVRLVHQSDQPGAVLVHGVVVRVPVFVCAVELVLAVALFLCSWHPVVCLRGVCACGRRGVGAVVT